MPFYVYGKNALTGEVAKRLFSAAPTKEEARQDAESQGLEVTEIVACNPLPIAAGVAGARATASAVASTIGSSRTGAVAAKPPRAAASLGVMSQFRNELDYATSSTWATFALIAANALLFGMMCLSGVSAKDPTVNGLMEWGADFGPSTLGGQWWRLVSSMFVHIGFLHLFYNMLALVPAGRSLERLVGNVNFLLIYLIAGLGGGLWALYWTPMILSAGASGAVFGVYGALGAVVLMRGRAMPPGLMAALKKSVITFVVYNALYSLQPGISLAAHVGGLAVGFACGLLVARPTSADEAEPIDDRALPTLALGAVLVLAGAFGLELRYPNLSGLQAAFARFDALDLKDSQVVKDAATKFDRKDISADEFAQIVDQRVLPDWGVVRDQMAAYQPVPAGLQGEISAAASYMQLREEGWKLLIEAVRDGGKEKLDVAGKKMHEANLAERSLFRGARTRIYPEELLKS